MGSKIKNFIKRILGLGTSFNEEIEKTLNDPSVKLTEDTPNLKKVSSFCISASRETYYLKVGDVITFVEGETRKVGKVKDLAMDERISVDIYVSFFENKVFDLDTGREEVLCEPFHCLGRTSIKVVSKDDLIRFRNICDREYMHSFTRFFMDLRDKCTHLSMRCGDTTYIGEIKGGYFGNPKVKIENGEYAGIETEGFTGDFFLVRPASALEQIQYEEYYGD